MKIQKEKGSLDLKKAKEDNASERWAIQIAEKFFDKIPIIPDIKKGTKSKEVRFSASSQIVKLAKTIVYMSPQFKHHNDVFRACLNFMRVIYHLMIIEQERNSQNKKKKIDHSYKPELSRMAGDLVKMLERSEKYNVWSRTLDIATETVNAIFHSWKQGLIHETTMQEDIKKTLNEVPLYMQKALQMKIEYILSGGKVTNILEKKVKGGDKQTERRFDYLTS